MSVRERIMSVPVAEHTRAACAQITSQTELRHLHYSPTSSFQSVFLFSPHDFEYSLSKNKWMIKKKSQNESVYVRINLWEAESANIFNQLKHLNINPVSNVLIKNTEDTQRVVEVESVINCNTNSLVQLSCGSVNAQLCLSDDCNFNFSVEQTRGQKYKLFSSLRLFSEWRTLYCAYMYVYVGGRVSIFVLGLYVSQWRSSCPTLNPDDGQKSLLKPARAIRQHVYIKTVRGSLHKQQSFTPVIIYLPDESAPDIFFCETCPDLTQQTEHTHRRAAAKLFNVVLQSCSKLLLAHKDRPSAECGVSSR